ncbi:MAG: AAA domain-containing protein [bacterium]|nr:AAA domain-containing protein [bacterium]
MYDEEKKTPENNEDIDEVSKEFLDFVKGSSSTNPFFVIDKDKKMFGSPVDPSPDNKSSDFEIKFNMKPKEIKDYLDRFVIQQDEAKKVLSVAIADHFNHIKACKNENKCQNYAKQNIIMVGPSGVGKTFLIKYLADLVGVPFVKSDATKFTETGYVGGDVEDLVRQLVTMANGNNKLAEYGIIYMDEIDKIVSSSDKMGKDVSGRGVQSNLLKLLEDTEVPLKAPWDIQSQIRGILSPKSSARETISTRHMLFIVSGAFVGLDDIVRRRIEGSKYGFERVKREIENRELIDSASTGDFINFGLEPEFIGRFPVRVFCNSLEVTDLYNIIKYSETSILYQFVDSFKHNGIDVLFTDKALKRISELAHKEETGARGLATIFERCFRDLKFELPSTNINKLVITRSFVDRPKESFEALFIKPEENERKYFELKINALEQKYFSDNKIKVKFNLTVRNAVLEKSKIWVDIENSCKAILAKLECGLNLLKKNPPEKEFVITLKVVNNPEKYLQRWVKESLRADKMNN